MKETSRRSGGRLLTASGADEDANAANRDVRSDKGIKGGARAGDATRKRRKFTALKKERGK